MQRFHPLVKQWFLSRFAAPTALQEQAWEAAGTGAHLLLTAPTGSGKTLAAFLWGLNRLLTRDLEGGTTRILYISPLKALNSDVRENLLLPLRELEAVFRNAGEPCPAIRVLTRSGDTPPGERQQMLRRPPEVLITTPESLNLLLATARGTAALGNVAVVVLDEIHALAADKRGAHLLSALERLEALAGPFQRIALSATVRPLERIAAFAGGFATGGQPAVPRPVRILQDAHPRRHQLTVTMPETAGSIWPDLTARLKEIIRANRSTLIFTNSRRLAERLARLLNEGEQEILAWAHHGSLSREIRRAVEERLKAGELRAIVATSSLELGIDIGALDTVVLVQTPPGTAATLQRLGRSNHRVGGESRGVLFPLHGMDLLAATAAALAAEDNSIEEIRPVNAPLDVLAQVLLAMGLTTTVDLEEAFTLLTRSWSFHRLSREDYDRVVAMLAGRYADAPLAELKPRIHLDRIAGTFRTRPEARLLLYAGGGTIPDRGYYTLRTADTAQKIGELDEEFVWERRVGDNFTLGSRVWRIDAITHNEVTVHPAGQGTGMVPFWKADDPDRGFLLSERIGLLLEQADTALAAGRREEALAGCRPLDDAGKEYLLRFLEEQRERCGGLLPHRHRIVAEHFSDPLDSTGNHQLVLHTGWGSGCNRPLALALAAAWEHKTGISITFWANNDCILLLLPGPARPDELFSLLTPSRLAEQMRSALEKSGLFGAVFRECAGRALLLPKKSFRQRQPLWLNRMRARRLLEAVSGYGDFPVIQECWRECLQERFNLPTLARLLEEVQEGRIALAEAWTTTPSPFAAEVLWRQTNVRMYQDDTPEGGGPARLAADLVARAAADSRLRPRIPAAAVALLESRLQRTAPGYAPLSGDDLLSHVRERLFIEETDCEKLFAALPEGTSDPVPAERLAWFTPPGGRPHLIALENLPRLEAAFGLAPGSAELAPFPPETSLSRERLAALLAPLEDTRRGTLAAVVLQYLEGKALVSLTALSARLGIGTEPLLALLQALAAAGRIVIDRITADAAEPEAVTTANLETLLRLTRRLRRPDFAPLPASRLPLFLARWQGLTERDGEGKNLPARLEQLLGWPGPAALWEEAILPARFAAYRAAWLDNLALTSGLAWRGCGREKITLLFPDDAGMFFPEGDPEAQTRAAALFPAERGRFSLLELAGPGGDSAALADTLWELAWAGVVGNDSFAALRQGCRTRFRTSPLNEQRAGSFNRWRGSRPLAGNWHCWPAGHAEPADPFAAEMVRRERVRQLLARYGVLCRELLARELPALRWGALFRTLRLMELSGELRGGIFFETLSAPQFINHAGWRALRRERDQEARWFVNAADPASCAGILPGLPTRRPATWLVYEGERLAAVAEKNGETLTLAPEVSPGVCRPLFETLLTRDCRPRREIRLLTVNGGPVAAPALEAALGESGFVKRSGVWELRRRY